ncbi:MAG: PAS domain S-box protein, partial [Gemmatimonadaceae bacterium]|nr:PAS domain S-box protein [Gemmatimonadaceae bacterium]
MNESSQLPSSAAPALLASIIGHAPLSLVAYDGAGRIVLWNAEAERLLGWRADDVLGKSPPFAMSDLFPGDAPREITRATRAGGVAHLSVTVRHIPLDGGGTV